MGFSRHTGRLFFAVCLNETTAADIVDLAWDFRDDYALRGLPLLPEHIHSTLWHVGDDFFPPPDELIQALSRRAGP
jgi:RNA 2',3'-cyclic 3'-phosphodiesterase